jgi:hypothetical protein
MINLPMLSWLVGAAVLAVGALYYRLFVAGHRKN